MLFRFGENHFGGKSIADAIMQIASVRSLQLPEEIEDFDKENLYLIEGTKALEIINPAETADICRIMQKTDKKIQNVVMKLTSKLDLEAIETFIEENQDATETE